jgi:hypothetical protein
LSGIAQASLRSCAIKRQARAFLLNVDGDSAIMERAAMEHYVALAVSLKLTAICIVDRTGKSRLN